MIDAAYLIQKPVVVFAKRQKLAKPFLLQETKAHVCPSICLLQQLLCLSSLLFCSSSVFCNFFLCASTSALCLIRFLPFLSFCLHFCFVPSSSVLCDKLLCCSEVNVGCVVRFFVLGMQFCKLRFPRIVTIYCCCEA